MNKKDINKIKKIVKKLSATIKDNGSYIWYVVTDDGILLVSKGETKNRSKKRALKKLEGRDDLIGDYLYMVQVVIDKRVIGNATDVVPGSININTSKYKLNNEYKLVNKKKYGMVWFSDEDLINYGFDTKYIKIIVEKVHEDEFMGFGAYDMTTFGDIMD